MDTAFEWDPAKAQSNLVKHGVSFAEAASVFRDTMSVTVPDRAHSEREERFITIGLSSRRRLLVIVHADPGERIRIISVRRATRRETRMYEEGN